MGGLDNPLETMSYYLTLIAKFMSDYLYFPNKLKDVEDRIWADMISYKMFFQLKVTFLKENLSLQVIPLIFYSSIRFLFKAVFIAENKFGALLEISDKLITKFNVFSYVILQS